MTHLKVLNCLHRAHFGGAQWRVVWIGEALRQHGIDTTVLFPLNHDMEYERFLRERNFPFARLKMPMIRSAKRANDNIKFLVDFAFQIRRILRFIRSNNFDLIHVNGMTNVGALIAAILAHKPIVWHWNDTLTPKWFGWLVAPLIKWTWLVGSSGAVWDNYSPSAYRNRYLGILLPPIPPDAPEPDNFNLGIEPGTFIVGYVGNFLEAKGTVEYVHTIAALRAEGRAITGIMVGAALSGHEQFEIKLNKLITNLGIDQHILRPGYRKDVLQIMRHFDVLLFPSHTEAAPIVVLQAISLGIPIVATDVGNLRELSSGMGSGMKIVPVGDLEALVKATRQILLLDKSERAAYSQRAQQIAKEFTVKRVTDRHLNIYETAIKNQNFPM